MNGDEARYFDLEVNGRRSAADGWSNADPAPSFRLLKGCVAF